MSCNGNDNCCCNTTVVEDCICCNWTLQGDTTDPFNDPVNAQVIYTATGLCPIVSGKVKFCSATADDETLTPPRSVLVQFLRGNTVIETRTVFLDSCIAFTVAKFDKIRIHRSAEHNQTRFTLSGEFCITPNYTLS